MMHDERDEAQEAQGVMRHEEISPVFPAHTERGAGGG